VLLNDLAHLDHPLVPFLLRHLGRAFQGFGNALEIEGVYQHGLIQLPGCAGELGENQNSITLGAAERTTSSLQRNIA
jgi:hypothetical protein